MLPKSPRRQPPISNLSNLQRGRLLDILLWAGELFLLLRIPRLTLAQSIASSENHFAARAAS